MVQAVAGDTSAALSGDSLPRSKRSWKRCRSSASQTADSDVVSALTRGSKPVPGKSPLAAGAPDAGDIVRVPPDQAGQQDGLGPQYRRQQPQGPAQIGAAIRQHAAGSGGQARSGFHDLAQPATVVFREIAAARRNRVGRAGAGWRNRRRCRRGTPPPDGKPATWPASLVAPRTGTPSSMSAEPSRSPTLTSRTSRNPAAHPCRASACSSRSSTAFGNESHAGQAGKGLGRVDCAPAQRAAAAQRAGRRIDTAGDQRRAAQNARRILAGFGDQVCCRVRQRLQRDFGVIERQPGAVPPRNDRPAAGRQHDFLLVQGDRDAQDEGPVIGEAQPDLRPARPSPLARDRIFGDQACLDELFGNPRDGGVGQPDNIGDDGSRYGAMFGNGAQHQMPVLTPEIGG